MKTLLLLTGLSALAALAPLQEPPQHPDPRLARDPAPGGRLVVLHKSDDTLAVFDPSSGEKLRASPTGTGPHEVALTSDGRLAVVADYGRQEPGRTLTVVDLERAEIVRTIDLGEHRRPHGIVVERDDRHALVTVEVNRAVLRVDLEQGAVVDSFETGQEASHMLVTSPDGSRAYVANIASGSLSVIDLVQGELLATIPTGAGAEGLDVTPDGREVWVGDRAADTLSVVHAGELAVVAELPCPGFPIRLKITPDGKHALVSNATAGEVAVFDVAERAELRRIPMEIDPSEDLAGRLFEGEFAGSPVPIGLVLEPDGQRAYVANTNADIVTVLDLATWTVVDRIPTGREPDGLAWLPR